MENQNTEQPEVRQTLSERLTENFYKWEHRGRGWLLWDSPVRLEPPFVPFIHHFAQEQVIDDGRRPTFINVITDKIKKRLTTAINAQADPNESEEDYFFSKGPEFFTEDAELCGVSVSVPADQKIDFDRTEHFLLNLKHCRYPVGFEIIGTYEEIVFQIVCRQPDYTLITQQLRAYFPEAVLYDVPSPQSIEGSNRPFVIVDFGLSEEFMRPLRTFRGFEPDPLTGIVGSMETLAEGEVAILQILFEPTEHPWSEHVMRAVTDHKGRSFFADCPEMLKLAQEKVKKPLLAAVIRVAGASDSESRAWEIARTLAAGLEQLSNPQSNALIPLQTDEEYPETLHLQDLYFRQSHRTGMLLNTDELISLVHLPSVSVRAAKLKREIKRTRPAPASVSGHKLMLGQNIHQGKTVDVSLSPDQRRRHTYIIGATGTGKSTLLLSMICQDIQQGQAVAVLDPHGDLIERILAYVPEERYDDVVLLDPADSEYPVGLNILSAYSELDKTLLSSDLVSVFRRLSTSWGDQMNSIFGNAVLAFLESEVGGTLVDLRRFLVERNYRDRFLQTVTDPEVVYYWKKEFPLLRGGAYSPILTRLDTFLRPKPIRNMVIQKEGLNFHAILNTKKIFLAKLSQGLIGVENSYLLGALLVSKFHQAAMARQAQSEEEREDFYLYIDEFQNFVTESMTEILSGARKYGFGLILAHQELRQLFARDSELASSVLSNPCTRICFRLGDSDAKKLEEGLSTFCAQDLQNLNVGEAIARIERADFDFNLKTFPPPDVPRELARERKRKLIDLSRQKYAASKEQLASQLAIIKEQLLEEPLIAEQPRTSVAEIREDVKQEVTTEPTLSLQRKRAEETCPETEEKIERQHSYLKNLIRRHAEAYGYKALDEEITADGLGRVDVHLERDGRKIACEISITTSDVQELQNTRKRLAAGYDEVILCSPEEKFLKKAEKLFSKELGKTEQEKILYLLPEQVISYLKQQAAKSASTEKQMKGRKVSLKFQPMTEEKERSTLKAIGSVIFDSMRRSKNKQ